MAREKRETQIEIHKNRRVEHRQAVEDLVEEEEAAEAFGPSYSLSPNAVSSLL